MDIQIRDVNTENADDLINLCIPKEKEDDPLFTEGIKVKKKWVYKVLKQYGSCAKLAYVGTTPVGMIQYVPNPDERIVEITCIFVPDSQYHKRGIGTALLKDVIEDMKTPQPYFNANPRALVTFAFEIAGWFSQHKFYLKMGFKPVDNNPYLVYYPLQQGYVYTRKEFTPQKEDEGKVLISFDPSCPWCKYFSEKIKEAIREITEIPIELINTFEDPQEVKKRGNIPLCVVNKIPIESFIADKERFHSEVRKALE